MAIELTKSAKKSLATLYREYCQRLNAGEKKAQAASFQSYSEFVMDNRKELKDAGFIRVDLLGNIYLTDKAIIYMEIRRQTPSKNGCHSAHNLYPKLFSMKSRNCFPVNRFPAWAFQC